MRQQNITMIQKEKNITHIQRAVLYIHQRALRIFWRFQTPCQRAFEQLRECLVLFHVVTPKMRSVLRSELADAGEPSESMTV